MKRPAPNLRAYAEINVEGRQIQRLLNEVDSGHAAATQ
jgi:hypothetical protein